ncbi:MAG: lipoate--protein ligase [Solidesulfovibrio sp.]|uniref:lipoate--protein ligase n=1 Tax=Solidesulfovibrio sp. TaxID=2910990 RepID=UPI002B20F75D|nr:lipoate--protein ligase [Solidesulfovibrio sp.]MEA4857142.1 lipoate--protein ligase [Solidesulfovibrio sp.]
MDTMRCLLLPETDPALNLATEEWLLRHGTANVFMLWRNAAAIIVGRNQNTRAQVNEAYVRAHGIPVVRRLTGGGAVFHDLGNVNFTFIDIDNPSGRLDFARYTAPILDALASMGVAARFDGRNDLAIDGQKISGNAQFLHGNRILHHGTLLFSASITDLSAALLVDPLKYRDKAVKSVAKRVTNISAHLPRPLGVEAFMDRVMAAVAGQGAVTDTPFTPEERAQIETLADIKYRAYDWNFGYSPEYAFSKSIRTAGGMVETHFDVRQGVIASLRFYGDFFGTRDVAGLEARLAGCPHEPEALLRRLDQVPLEDFMLGVTAAALVEGFF